MPNIIKVFSGNANPELAKEICDYLKISLSKVEVRRFSDGEIFIEIGEGQKEMSEKILRCYNIDNYMYHKDLSGIYRVLEIH